MIAIIEYKKIDSNTNKIVSVRFSENIAVNTSTRSGNSIKIANLKGRLYEDNSDNEAYLLQLLNNSPQDVSIGINLETGDAASIGDGTIQTGTSPYARKLSDEDITEKATVRPAAHRAGQASFFGNL